MVCLLYVCVNIYKKTHKKIKNKKIKAAPYKQMTSDCWIGLNDQSNEGTFVWQDGTAFDYGNDVSGGVWPWQNGQPNDGR